jgi:hypothetical protein
MSQMYGKRRAVLGQDGRVAVCGSREPGTGGSYAMIGWWYKECGLFYADLASAEQQYGSGTRNTVINKRAGGVPTKQALREFVLNYYTTVLGHK